MKTDNLKYMSASTMADLKTANVYWQPNRYCNYECSYCWPTAHTKVKDFIDKDLAMRTIDRCVEKFTEKGVTRINWGWSGGEATFHPNFLEFQERILSHKSDELRMSFNLTTNLSHNMPWWKKFVETTKDYWHLAVSASLHQEFVDTKDKVDKFIEKIEYLESENIKIMVNQVMDPDIFDDQLKALERFYEKNFRVNTKVNSILHKHYMKHTGKTIYTDEQLSKMHQSQKGVRKGGGGFVMAIDENDNFLEYDTFEQVKNDGLWYLTDWLCSAGYLSIAIEDGVIKRGVGGCHQQIIGKLDEEWELHDEPKLCGLKNNHPCTCVADLKMPKWNPEHVTESEWKKIKTI